MPPTTTVQKLLPSAFFVVAASFGIYLFHSHRLRHVVESVVRRALKFWHKDVPFSVDCPKGDSVEGHGLIQKVNIVFGSQTGTAEAFAKRLRSILATAVPSCSATVMDCSDVNGDVLLSFEKHSTPAVWIFCISTHGEGEPPDNARAFFRWLTKVKSLSPERQLAHLRYAILGFGSREYEQFNGAARLLDKRLQRLGARSLCSRGEADDSKDVELDALDWIQTSLLPVFRKTDDVACRIDPCLNARQPQLQREQRLLSHWKELINCGLDNNTSRFLIDYSTLSSCQKPDATRNTPESCLLYEPDSTVSQFYFSSFHVPVRQSTELLTNPALGNCPSVKHLDLDTGSAFPITNSCGEFETLDAACSLKYQPGATVEVLTANEENRVQWWYEFLFGKSTNENGITLDTRLYFPTTLPKTSDGMKKCLKVPFPNGCTLHWILRYYCELHGCPDRDFFRHIAAFMQDPLERSRLESLIAPESHHTFNALVRDPMLDLRDAVRLFCNSARVLDLHSDQLSSDSQQRIVAFLLCVLPRKRPRAYSASSSPSSDPLSLSLTVGQLVARGSAQPRQSSDSKFQRLVSLRQLAAEAAETLTSRNLSASEGLALERLPDEKRGKFNGCVSTELCAPLESLITKKVLLRVLPTAPAVLRLLSRTEPLVFIAAGTGVAPCRSLWKELEYSIQHCPLNDHQRTRRRIFLVYGCTHPDVDFLYRDELETPESQSHMLFSERFFAFSRQLRNTKVYVQDVLRQEEVSHLFRHLFSIHSPSENRDAAVYVCGSKKMGKGVRSAFSQILGKRRVKQLVHEQRYLEDLWT